MSTRRGKRREAGTLEVKVDEGVDLDICAGGALDRVDCLVLTMTINSLVLDCDLSWCNVVVSPYEGAIRVQVCFAYDVSCISFGICMTKRICPNSKPLLPFSGLGYHFSATVRLKIGARLLRR